MTALHTSSAGAARK